MYSCASLILLLMYCVHSFCFSVVSISSSLTSWKDISLSSFVLELCSVLSSFSSLVVYFFSFSSCFFFSSWVSSAASFLFFDLYFLFICTMRRSIFYYAIWSFFHIFEIISKLHLYMSVLGWSSYWIDVICIIVGKLSR